MTREEAIDIIKCLAWHTRPTEEMIEQAIKELEQELNIRNCFGCKYSKDNHNAGTEECHLCMWENQYTPTTKNDLGVASGLEKNSKKLEKDFGESDCISREDALMCLTGMFENREYEPSELIKIFARRIKTLPSVTPQEPSWIPVSERLPEENKRILLNVRMPHYQVVRSGMYHDELFSLDNGDCWRVGDIEAVAWMPAPKEYKEGE